MWRVRFGLHICSHHNGLVGTFIHLHTCVCSFIHFTHFCCDHNRGVSAGGGHGNKCLGFSTAPPPVVIQFTTTNSIGNPLTTLKLPWQLCTYPWSSSSSHNPNIPDQLHHPYHPDPDPEQDGRKENSKVLANIKKKSHFVIDSISSF